MLIPLTEVLRLPAARAAGIEVLAGSPEEVRIRWVHSSEVYEMGSLLAGGELLLTTGLGLHGRTSEQLAAYVRRLADAGCAALAIELGRSFFEVPEPMVAEARRTGLVLLALTKVVPFERFGEDFHELLLHRRLGAAAQGEVLLQELVAEVLAGAGLRALLDAVSRTAGCAVELYDPDDQLVERSSTRSVEAEGTTLAQVRAAGTLLGRLVFRAPDTDRLRTIADRAAVAVALELGRLRGPGSVRDPAESLLTDLLADAVHTPGEVRRRLDDLGWRCSPDRPLLPLAVDLDPRVPLAEETAAVAATAHTAYGGALVTTVGGDALLLVRAAGGPARIRRATEEWYADLAARLGRRPLVAATTPVADPAAVGPGLQDARTLLRDARDFGVRSRLTRPRDLAMHQLLSALPAERLERFIADQIGLLVEHDRRHASTLVRTLDALLRAGGSKQAAAVELGIRRQTLYARIQRIESLLGADLADPLHRTGLAAALVAWRVRTGIDP